MGAARCGAQHRGQEVAAPAPEGTAECFTPALPNFVFISLHKIKSYYGILLNELIQFNFTLFAFSCYIIF